MGITIVSTHRHVSGSLLNMFDLKQYIQKNNSEVCSRFLYTQPEKPYWQFMKNDVRGLYSLKNMKNIDDVSIDDNVVITDIRGIMELHHFNRSIVCGKLIVLDSVELSYNLNKLYDAGQWFSFRTDYSIPLTKYLENIKFDECVFLMPPSNINRFNQMYSIPCLPFFKRIYVDALMGQDVGDNGKLFVRRDTDGGVFDSIKENYDVVPYEREIDMFSYRGMIYHRRNRIGNHEQFGRLVFEFIMLGKDVYFVEDPFETEDGLSDYLRHYNIEFQGRRVITRPKELIDKMQERYEVEPWI